MTSMTPTVVSSSAKIRRVSSGDSLLSTTSTTSCSTTASSFDRHTGIDEDTSSPAPNSAAPNGAVVNAILALIDTSADLDADVVADRDAVLQADIVLAKIGIELETKQAVRQKLISSVQHATQNKVDALVDAHVLVGALLKDLNGGRDHSEWRAYNQKHLIPLGLDIRAFDPQETSSAGETGDADADEGSDHSGEGAHE